MQPEEDDLDEGGKVYLYSLSSLSKDGSIFSALMPM